MTSDSIEQLIERFKTRDRSALARIISLVENDQPEGREALDRLYPLTGSSRIVGVTGPPGGGKSTLVNALIAGYRDLDRSIGVLAFDPSSRASGGAALGDRIRMLDTWDDPGVYVRSMASRGQLGGLSAAVYGAAHVLDAFGFDQILIETVGVGQGEVDIADIADTTLLIQVPGAGDAVQLIKAGVLEIADILVVNKADMPGAGELANDLRSLANSQPRHGWIPPVQQTVARDGTGIPELIESIDRHGQQQDRDALARRRVISEVRKLAIRRFEQRLSDEIARSEESELIEEVLARRLTPHEAAARIERALGID